MSRKILIALTFSIAISMFLSGAMFSVLQAEAKKITIRAVSAWPKNEKSVADDFLPFIKHANDAIGKKYPGQFEIRYTGGPEVIPTADQGEAVRVGIIDMLFGTPAYYVGIAPEANCGKLSQLTSQEEKDIGADAVFDEIHRKKLNAVYLGRLGSEIPFQLYTVKRVTNMEEIKGLRIRTSAMNIDFLKALGTTPIETKPGDIYQALERGVVDGMMWPLFSIRPWGWHEVAEYIVGPPFYKVCHPIVINKKTWNRIPAHIQEELYRILAFQAQVCDVKAMEQIKNEHELLKEAGMEVIKFSPEDEKKYLEMAYEEGWKGQLKMESAYTSKLRKLLTR